MTSKSISKIILTALIPGVIFGLCVNAITQSIKAGVIVCAIFAVIFGLLAFFSEKRFAGVMQKVSKHLGGKSTLFYEKATLFTGKETLSGILVLTKDEVFFLHDDAANDKLKTELKLSYKEILSHKLHVVIFLEGPDHRIYEIRSNNGAKAYNIINEKCK